MFLWASFAKFSHSDEIVSCGGQGEVPIDFLNPPVSGLSQIADHLDPAKGLFNALSNLDARLVAFVTRRSAINGRFTILVILSYMRGGIIVTENLNEVFGVVSLVTTPL